MGVFGLFGSKGGFDPKAFEKDLTTLTENITSTKQQIVKLRARNNHVRRLLIQYLVSIYVLIFAYCYTTVPKDVEASNRLMRFLKGQTKRHLLILVLYPIISVLVIRLTRFLFQFFIDSRSKYLKTLEKNHKKKIEELKEITNFNKTNELINKYDRSARPRTPQQQSIQQPQFQKPTQNIKQAQPQINNRQEALKQKALRELNLPKQPNQLGNFAPQSQIQQQPQAISPVSARPITPSHRTIQDRLLDILIGSDNSESVEQRYALICYNCFAHNGLAPPNTDDPVNIKYQCWKCGKMNGKGMLFEGGDPDSVNMIRTDSGNLVKSAGAIPTIVSPSASTSAKSPSPSINKEEGSTSNTTVEKSE